MYRLFLKCLLLTGPKKKIARIDFTKGLNVISGPSDTGKTFIFQCLNYCLGANEVPKHIKEAEGYTRIQLSFNINDSSYTISRDFATNNIELYESDIDNINSNDKPIKTSVQKISDILMEKLGISNAKLLKNKNGGTVNLTINKFRKLSFINETEVQSENSPFLSGELIFQTQEKAFMNYVLDGTNYNDVIKNESKEIAQAKLQARIDLLEELIGDTSQIPNEEEIRENTEQIEKLKIAILNTNKKFFDINTYVHSLEEKRTKNYNEIIKTKSKISYKQETINRFKLLLQRYHIDIERLTAILDSSDLFLSTENKTITCPLCRSHINNSDENIRPEYIKNIKKSCENEIFKIEGLQSELKETIEVIEKEKKEQEKYLKDLENNLAKIQSNLSTILKDEISKVKDELYVLYSKKSNLETLSIKYKNVDELIKLKETNKNMLNTKSPKTAFSLSVKSSTMYRLCECIHETLQSWDFPELKTVSFSEENNDIIIGDKDRKSFGKGYRAIMRSAFNISLMRYCLNNNLPHLGFVVLDSPVLTFRGINTKNTEYISDSLKDNFYIALSEYSDDFQIIVIENKEPPTKIISKINYISFTKNENDGRYGFIPID